MKRKAGSDVFSLSIDTSSLDAYLDGLAEQGEKSVRPVAQAMAQVLYERVSLNVSALGKKTGNLASSIYQAYSAANSATGRRATYHVSWNPAKAPHGHLVEYGFLQRYRYYKGNDGKIRPMVRPGMEGKPRPSRKASAQAKAEYYVTLPVPLQIPGHAFVRRAAAAMPQALQAGEAELIRRMQGKT